MERLTENYLGCNQIKDCGIKMCGETCKEVESCDVCPISKAIDKLAEYEQAEEDGLLIRLPCKVGDVLWYLSKNKNKVIPVEVMTIKYVCEAENYGVFILERILIQGKGIEPTVIHFSDIGKRVFPTEAEAEQALAKMEGE